MNGQIGGEAAVPVGDTVDHHGVVHVGQAGRGEQGVDRQLLAREDAHLAGLHVGGGDEGLDLAAAAHGLFVEMPTQHLAQRSNFSGLRCHGESVRWIRSAHSAPGESSRFQLPCRRSSSVRWMGLATAIVPSSVQKAASAARAPRPPPCRARLTRLVEFMRLFSTARRRYVHRRVTKGRRVAASLW
jgi:hypothetical protein